MSATPRAWPPPLRWLLPGLFAAVIAGVSGLELFAGFAEVRRSVERSQRDRVASDLAAAAEAFDYYTSQGALDRIRQKLAFAALSPHVVGSFVVGSDGVVIAATRLDQVGTTAAATWSELGMAEPAAARSLLAVEPNVEQPHVEVAGHTVWGAVAVVLPGPVEAIGLRDVRRAWLVEVADLDSAVAVARAGAELSFGIGVGASLLIAALVAVGIRRTMVQRIAGLVDVTGRLRAGDLAARAKLQGGDEIAELGAAFDAMAEQLAIDRLQLSESEQRFRRIYETASDGILLIDATGHILDANPSGCQLLRMPRDRLLGLALGELFETSDESDAVIEAISLDAPTLIQRRISKSDGAFATVEMSARRLPDGRIIAILRDLTERMSMQERLARSERLASLGTLAAGVAHEMNNPLSYVLANLSLTAERLEGPLDETGRAELRELVSDALDGARRVAAVVGDMRAFSRTDPAGAAAVDLRGVVKTALKMAELATRPKARVVTDLGPAPLVRGDENKLVQVVLNLVINAAQATDEQRPGDEIRIETRATEAGDARLIVSDTGTGIPPDVLPRIFDPFVTTKPVGVGTGLGLWVCHDVISSLGGRIDVESTVGRGTTFTITLPAAPASAPAVTPAATPRPSPEPSGEGCEGLRVLLIDDEPLVSRVLARALRGAKVDIADGGAEGIRRLGEATYDVVVCDISMPVVDGGAVLEWLEGEQPALARRTLVATGGATTDRARALLARIGEERLVQKPITPEAFRGFVARAARR